MAFVLVQHLDPNYESSLAAIVAGYTAMPVHLAEDGAVAKDRIVDTLAHIWLTSIYGEGQ